MNGHHSPSVRLALRITLALSLVAGPVLSGRSLADPAQTQVDALVQQVENSAQQAGMPVTLTIDHARLAEQAGSPMEPATVVMVRQTELESRWLRANPNLALELPLRVLAHQTESHPSVRVSHQEGAALLARHGLSDPALAATYDRAVAALLQRGAGGAGASRTGTTGGRRWRRQPDQPLGSSDHPRAGASDHPGAKRHGPVRRAHPPERQQERRTALLADPDPVRWPGARRPGDGRQHAAGA